MIRSMSKKRSAESRIYAKQKKLFLHKNEYCFCCGSWTYPAERDLHHLRGRAGRLYLDERFWEMACADCHRKIHTERKWAITNGFLAGAGEWGYCPA